MIEIITNVPTLSVSRQVIDFLISRELKNLIDEETQTNEVSGDLKMLELVIKSGKSSSTYTSLALSFLNICLKEEDSTQSSIAATCEIVQSIAKLLGQKFDGFKLVESIIDCNKQTNEIREIRIISRLVFECLVIMVPAFLLNGNVECQSIDNRSTNGDGKDDAIITFSKKLFDVKKIVLAWFLSSNSKVAKQSIEEGEFEYGNEHRQKLNEPDFDSILDGETVEEYSEDSLFDIIRFSMFLVKPDTSQMIKFINIGVRGKSGDNFLDTTEDLVHRINFCMNYGCGVDDKLLHIIIRSSNSGPIDAKQAISLVELLLYNCRNKENAYFNVNDSDVVWDLYNLSEYSPKVNGDKVPR